MLASGVATGLAKKMANMDKPNLLVQPPEAFAKAAVATIGIQDDTFGCFNHACQVSCMSVPQARADPGGGGGGGGISACKLPYFSGTLNLPPGISRATDNGKWLHLFTCPTDLYFLHFLPFLAVGLGLPPIAS